LIDFSFHKGVTSISMFLAASSRETANKFLEDFVTSFFAVCPLLSGVSALFDFSLISFFDCLDYTARVYVAATCIQIVPQNVLNIFVQKRISTK
jgi:hypothetical protein